MKERHWSSLVTGIRHGQTVLVLGSEVPANLVVAQPGSTASEALQVEGLRLRLAVELAEGELSPRGDTLSSLAQQYEDALDFGSNALRASAETFYASEGYAPSAVHRTIASLPFSLILTSCHDELLERALRDEGKTPVTYRYHLRGDKRENPEFSAAGSPAAPVIYHLFGVGKEPPSLVLSENDLLDFLIGIVSDRPPLPSSLAKALKRAGQSFLFVGFGIKYWYPRLLLKVLLRVLELQPSGSAFAAEPLLGLSDVDREQTVLFYQRGTRIEVADLGILDFLTEMTKRLTLAGGYVGRDQRVGARARVFVSYASEDKSLAARVFEALDRSTLEPWLDQDGLRGGQLWDQAIQDELAAVDFTLVLHTPALARKTDSYVNSEIDLARRRARSVRGAFLIPLRTADLKPEERIAELADYQEMVLNSETFEEDMSKVISTMVREYQRRNR